MKLEINIDVNDIMAVYKILHSGQTLYRVRLIDCSDNKIMVIKIIRQFYPDMGLKVAKCDYCDNAPITLPPLSFSDTIKLYAELSKWAKIDVTAIKIKKK